MMTSPNSAAIAPPRLDLKVPASAVLPVSVDPVRTNFALADDVPESRIAPPHASIEPLLLYAEAPLIPRSAIVHVSSLVVKVPVMTELTARESSALTTIESSSGFPL